MCHLKKNSSISNKLAKKPAKKSGHFQLIQLISLRGVGHNVLFI